jgi:hypothetical protein
MALHMMEKEKRRKKKAILHPALNAYTIYFPLPFYKI